MSLPDATVVPDESTAKTLTETESQPWFFNYVPGQTKLSWDFAVENATPALRYLLGLLLLALVLRLALSNVMHGHPTDINNFKAWCMHAAQHPLREFYQSDIIRAAHLKMGIWCDYPPLYVLVLWVVGKFYLLTAADFTGWQGFLFTSLVKMPAIVADLGCVVLLVTILKRYVHVYLALLAGTIFAFHPSVIYESAMWGQVDSITLVLQLLALWLMIRQQWTWAIVVTVANILVKPQGLILLPLVLVVPFWRRQWLSLAVGILGSLALAWCLTWLFVPADKILPWLWNQYVKQADLYPFSAIQSFNLWSLTGMWSSDVARGIFGLGGDNPPRIWQHKTWGLILFSLAYATCLAYCYIKEKTEPNNDKGMTLLHTSTLIMIAFFLFPTRMHERYLYSGLFLLLGSAMLIPRLLAPFLILSVSFQLNLFYELPGYTGLKKGLEFPSLFYLLTDTLHQGWFKVLAVINLLMFATILYWLFRLPLQEGTAYLLDRIMTFLQDLKKGEAELAQDVEHRGRITALPLPKALDRIDIYWIWGLLLWAAIPKMIRLAFPPEMVFDEVYHARAGGEYALGMHPFEWVHPPLAKLLITLGVQVYDLTAMGWRIVPVIAGVLLVLVVYLLARFTLPHRWQAIVATFLLTCDGVYFVQSRTAMTNIFATLFQVSAVAFLWRYLQYDRHDNGNPKNYWYLGGASFFIGISLATRWTSLGSWAFIIMVLLCSKILPGFDLYRWVIQGTGSKRGNVFAVSGRALLIVLLPVWLKGGLSLLRYLKGQPLPPTATTPTVSLWDQMMSSSVVKLLAPEANMHLMLKVLSALCVLLLIYLVATLLLFGFSYVLRFIPTHNRLGQLLHPQSFDPVFLALFPLFFVAIPLLIYVLSYSQYMGLGHHVKDVLEMQRGIWNYHANLDQPHPYYSAWYTWPFLYRPTWYYYHSHGNQVISGILAVGNPILWWMTIPALFSILGLAMMQRRLQLWYLGLAAVAVYLPWGLSPRTLNYSHYFFEAVPYACIAIAYLLGEMVSHWKQQGVWIARAYVGLVFGVFVMFFPIYSAMLIPESYYRILIWFRTWV